MSSSITLELHRYARTPIPVGTATVRVLPRKGWIACRYKGTYYEILGGIRTPYWINLDRSLTKTKRKRNET